MKSSKYAISPENPLDISRGAPTPETSFPIAQHIASGAIDLNAISQSTPFGYNGPDFMGYGPLREYLAEQHQVSPEQIIIGDGGMATITMVMNAVRSSNIAQGTVIFTVGATYDRFLQNVRNLGLRLYGTDPFGQSFLPGNYGDNPKTQNTLAYLVADGHNPTGHTYTPQEREQLKAYFGQHHTSILWDGAYSQFVNGLPTAQEIGEGNIFVGNNTKTIAPGQFKIGWAVVPKSLVEVFRHFVSNARLNSDYFRDATVLHIMQMPEYQEHLKNMRELFHSRANALVSAVQDNNNVHFAGLEPGEVPQGYFAQVHFPSISKDHGFDSKNHYYDAGSIHEAWLAKMKAMGLTAPDARANYTPNEAMNGSGLGELRIPFAILQPEQFPAILKVAQAAAEKVVAK